MSRTTTNVSFYCRESKKNRDGRAPIELTIVINGKRSYIQLPRKEYPYQFKAQTTGKKRTESYYSNWKCHQQNMFFRIQMMLFILFLGLHEVDLVLL